MNEDLYWSIIASSLKATQSQDEQHTFLTAALEKLTPGELIGFHLKTTHFLNETYTSEMWCAGSIMNTRCSDDGFEDFRCWVISRGKEVYYNAKENPDSLVNELIAGHEVYAFEQFGYLAMEAFEATTGEDLMDMLEDSDPGTSQETFTPIEFNWQSSNPESMKRICPRLFTKFRE